MNRSWTALVLSAGVLLGCSQSDEGDSGTTTYYQRKISPILHTSCAKSPTGSSCHVTQDSLRRCLGIVLQGAPGQAISHFGVRGREDMGHAEGIPDDLDILRMNIFRHVICAIASGICDLTQQDKDTQSGKAPGIHKATVLE